MFELRYEGQNAKKLMELLHRKNLGELEAANKLLLNKFQRHCEAQGTIIDSRHDGIKRCVTKIVKII